MRYLAVLSASVFMVFGASAQISEKSQVRLYVQVPRNVVLTAVAVQPHSPLAFEEVAHLAGLKGGFANSYRLRNISNKSIRAFTVGTSSGSEWSMSKDEGSIVMPGELVPEMNGQPDNVVSLTSDLRKRQKLQGPMRSIIILMVLNVEFADGSSFQDEITFRQMTAFMDKIGDSLRRDEELKNRTQGKAQSRKK